MRLYRNYNRKPTIDTPNDSDDRFREIMQTNAVKPNKQLFPKID